MVKLLHTKALVYIYLETTFDKFFDWLTALIPDWLAKVEDICQVILNQ